MMAGTRAALALLVTMSSAVSCSTVPAGHPAPYVQPRETAIDWEISPAEGYADAFGYVRLDFAPPAGSEGGGRLTVHLGRQGLDHANTAWYSFTVTEGASTLLSLEGVEGIPNIKGPDGNWWNTIDLDLPRPVVREVHVAVEDQKIGVTYTFTLRRLVRLGMVS